MKTNSTKNIKNLLENFDFQLLSMLKEDLSTQKLKIKTKLVNMATIKHDKELLEILKSDMMSLKARLNGSYNNLAQAV